MEPRSFDRGGPAGLLVPKVYVELQWSRGLSTAEGHLARAYQNTLLRLQWSRGLSTAEGAVRSAMAGPAA